MSYYLRKFANQAAYNQATIHKPSVSLLDDSKSLIYDPNFHFDPKYLYSDLTTSSTLDTTKTVVGIEVVPAKHAPNGRARYMSVKIMDLTDPANGTTSGTGTGSSSTGIMWGASGAVSGMSYLPYPKALANDGTNLLYELQSEVDGYYLPGDTNETDSPGVYPFMSGVYTYTDEGLTPILPYLFNKFGNREALANQVGTALMDFDGAGNTAKIVAQATAGTTGEISNSSSAGNYPAAMVCHRFRGGETLNISGWYLPAMGELAYLWANIAAINAKIAAIPSGAVCVGMGESSDYPTSSLGDFLWSSSLYDTGGSWLLLTYGGGVYDFNRDYDYNYLRVRAFISPAA